MKKNNNLKVKLEKVIAEDIQIKFDSVDSIKRQINNLDDIKKEIYQIQGEIDSKFRKLGFTNFLNKAGELGSRAFNFSRGVGEAALGIKLMLANIAIPIVSDVVSDKGEELLGSGVNHLAEAFENKDVSKSKQDEIKDLLAIKLICDDIIDKIDNINQFAKECIKSKIFIDCLSNRDEVINLETDVRDIIKSIKIKFFEDINLFKLQIQKISEAENSLNNLQNKIMKIITTLNNHIDKNKKFNIKYTLNLNTLEILLSIFKGYILGIKINKDKELVILVHNKKPKKLVDIINDLNNLESNICFLKSQCKKCNIFCENITNYLQNIQESKFTSKVTTDSLQSIINKVNQLAEEIRIDYGCRKTKFIQESIDKITISKKSLKKLATELEATIQLLKNCFTCKLEPKTVETLLSIFCENLTELQLDTNDQISLFINGKKSQFNDTSNPYIELRQYINNLIPEASKIIEKAEQLLIIKQKQKQKNIYTVLALLFFVIISLGIGLKDLKTQHLITYLNFSKDTVKDNINIKIEEVSQTNSVKQKENVSVNLESESNLEAAKKTAIEASVIVQNPPHPIETWQQAQIKWQESIKLLETIPEDSSIYPQIKDRLVSYRANHTAISQRIFIELKAKQDFETAQKLAWKTALMLQNPPKDQKVWKEAQLNLQQAINLLSSIPEGTSISRKAKEKLIYYRNNYTAIKDKK